MDRPALLQRALLLSVLSIVVNGILGVTAVVVGASSQSLSLLGFGLDAAKEPHGFASVAMRLSTYRKLEPGALEEVVFFDHPSGRARVERAMTWLKEHPPQ